LKSELATLTQQKPWPIPSAVRVIRRMDDPPSMNEIAGAKEQAREWVEVPCSESMQPVQDVLRILLAHIGELERQNIKLKG
jgi:hypothetical protein